MEASDNSLCGFEVLAFVVQYSLVEHYQLLCFGVAFDSILDNYFDEGLKNDFSR